MGFLSRLYTVYEFYMYVPRTSYKSVPWYTVYHINRVGQNHTFIGIYGVYTVFLAGKSPYIRSYTVQIYGSGQPNI